MNENLFQKVSKNPNSVEYINNDIPSYAKKYLDYSESFGLQWNKFIKTQLDSYTNTKITEDRLARIIGDISKIQGKIVLEIGCGAGRFTEILLKYGAIVVSVDMSTAVVANKKNFPISESHIIIQADMNDLPFKENIFDYIICLGVLQHTPDTFKSIENSMKFLKMEGTYVCDHYTHTVSYYTKTTYLFRKYLAKFNKEEKFEKINSLFNLFFPLHKAVRKLYPLQMLLSRISPIHVYFHAYPELSLDHQREWALLDTHDSLADPYKRHLSKSGLRKYLKMHNYKIQFLEYGGNGIEARFIRSV